MSAYSDFHDAQCPEPDLQAYAAELVSLPPISLADTNGNLLPDDWECLLLGGSGNPDDDLDKDGNTNLQEYFDGTDPKDPLQKNPVKIDPKLSPIEIALKPGNQSELKFNFPAPYANQVKFTIGVRFTRRRIHHRRPARLEDARAILLQSSGWQRLTAVLPRPP